MKWLRRVVGFLLLSSMVFLLLDWGYAQWVAYRYRQWEATVERDALGVRAGFQSISKGEGRNAVLLVHGFASSPVIFRHYLAYFADQGMHARALRLPGFGDTLDLARDVEAGDWVDAVTRELQSLRREHDAVWVIAHSLGGAVTLTALRAEPELIDGLILLAPLFDVSRVRSPWVEPRRLFTFGQRFRLNTDVLESVLPVDARDPALRAWENAYRDRFFPLSIYEALFAIAEEARATRLSAALPVALYLSTRDEIIDPHSALHWFDQQPTDLQNVEWVESSGHLLMLDTGWEETLKAIAGFMQEAGFFDTPHQPSPK